MRLAVLSSHPIQYYAPLFRTLARDIDLQVFFAHRATPAQQAAAGFGEAFDWDVDLTSGYAHSFLRNVAARPATDHFLGCDTPEIGARLRQGGFDALLVFGWGLKCFLQATLAAKRMGLPVLVRGDSQLTTPRSPITRLAKALVYPAGLRLFDAALYVGERSRAYYEHYRYPAERLFFSPHCVDNAWFADRASETARHDLRARLGLSPGDVVVLFAGKLMPFKRPQDVIGVCARLADQGARIHMLVAGAGGLETELRARGAAAGVSIHWLGFQNQTLMPAAYAAADMMMLPSSERETWGLVCNEALACGRPIVVADSVGCAPDLAADGTAGRVYPLGDIDLAAEAVADLARSPPSPQAIKRKSDQYGLDAAAEGVRRALSGLGLPKG